MIALCVGMYRGCSTWQYGVVGAILEKHRDAQRLGFVEGIRYEEKLAENPITHDWAVLKAHDYHAQFGGLLASGQAVGFYSYRDLRDALSSYIHKTGTDLDDLLERGFIDLCLNNDRAWRAQPGMLVQRYDDLIADPARGVAEIARHLGVELAPGEAETIAEATSLEANRRKVESLSAQWRDQGVNLVAQDLTRFDPVSLLHWNHIRATTPNAVPDPAIAARQRSIVEHHSRPWLVANGFTVAARDEPSPPAVRTAYAPAAVDIRLDRFFRGIKGTVYDFDAPHPTTANASYHFFLRGWRGFNVATQTATRDQFAGDRCGDVNVVCSLGTPTQAPKILAELITASRLQSPDLVILNPATDATLVVGAIIAAGWRPQVYVVDQADDAIHAPAWRRHLEDAGYLPIPRLAGPAVFVRPNLVASIPMLAQPLGPADHFRYADDRLAPTPVVEPPEPPSSGEQTNDQFFKSWLLHVGTRLLNLVWIESAPSVTAIRRPKYLTVRSEARAGSVLRS